MGSNEFKFFSFSFFSFFFFTALPHHHPTEAVAQQPRELRVAVRHVNRGTSGTRVGRVGSLRQGVDAFAQRGEAAVDVHRLAQRRPRGPALLHALAARQIHEQQLTPRGYDVEISQRRGVGVGSPRRQGRLLTPRVYYAPPLNRLM